MLPDVARAVAAARASFEDLMALYRVAIPAARRARHTEARAVARPFARAARDERPRCGARTRAGGTCNAPVVWRPGEDLPRRRCRLHGGASTGPRTPEGRARSLAALGHVVSPLPGAGPVHVEAHPECSGCTLASRRWRCAGRWDRAHAGKLSPREVLLRLARATRCPEHGRGDVRAVRAALDAGRVVTVRMLLPGA